MMTMNTRNYANDPSAGGGGAAAPVPPMPPNSDPRTSGTATSPINPSQTAKDPHTWATRPSDPSPDEPKQGAFSKFCYSMGVGSVSLACKFGPPAIALGIGLAGAIHGVGLIYGAANLVFGAVVFTYLNFSRKAFTQQIDSHLTAAIQATDFHTLRTALERFRFGINAATVMKVPSPFQPSRVVDGVKYMYVSRTEKRPEYDIPRTLEQVSLLIERVVATEKSQTEMRDIADVLAGKAERLKIQHSERLRQLGGREPDDQEKKELRRLQLSKEESEKLAEARRYASLDLRELGVMRKIQELADVNKQELGMEIGEALFAVKRHFWYSLAGGTLVAGVGSLIGAAL